MTQLHKEVKMAKAGAKLARGKTKGSYNGGGDGNQGVLAKTTVGHAKTTTHGTVGVQMDKVSGPVRGDGSAKQARRGSK